MTTLTTQKTRYGGFMAILGKFRKSNRLETHGNLDLKVNMEEKRLLEILPASSTSALPDQTVIKDWVEEYAKIIEGSGKLPRQEIDMLAVVGGSKQFCPLCRADGCAGCLLEKAFLQRQAKARRIAAAAKQIWGTRVQYWKQAGLQVHEARRKAARDISESDLYQEWRAI
jgi:hypothetical protein